jgi:hypothetical protein
MAVLSILGLVLRGSIYPSDELAQGFITNDAANLVIGLPILLGSMALARRGKLVGLLFWPGALFYVVYTYIVYAIAMPLSWYYPAYPILAVGGGALTWLAYTAVDGDAVKARLSGRVFERLCGGVMVFFGAFFLLRAASITLGAVTSAAPLSRVEIALLAADAFIAPILIIWGIWLWRRRPGGYAAGLGLLFQTSMLFLGLILVFLIGPWLTGTAIPWIDVLIVAVMGAVFSIPLVLFLRGIRA